MPAEHLNSGARQTLHFHFYIEVYESNDFLSNPRKSFILCIYWHRLSSCHYVITLLLHFARPSQPSARPTSLTKLLSGLSLRLSSFSSICMSENPDKRRLDSAYIKFIVQDICRESLLHCRTVTMWNKCLLSPLPITLSYAWLALYQQLFYLIERGLFCSSQMTAHVYLHAVEQHFILPSQGPPGLSGARGDKVGILLQPRIDWGGGAWMYSQLQNVPRRTASRSIKLSRSQSN